jgi:hypothetical protein
MVTAAWTGPALSESFGCEGSSDERPSARVSLGCGLGSVVEELLSGSVYGDRAQERGLVGDLDGTHPGFERAAGRPIRVVRAG